MLNELKGVLEGRIDHVGSEGDPADALARALAEVFGGARPGALVGPTTACSPCA
jgi:hypothetical protein